MRTLFLALLILVTLLLSSCATIMDGSDANVSFTSTPSNALVTVTTQAGRKFPPLNTPAVMVLPRSETYVVDITLEGYKPQKMFITQDINMMFFGNFIVGGLIGMVVDYSTGAMWNLKPNFIHVSLETASAGGEEQLYAVVKSKNAKDELQSVSVPLEPLEP